MGQSSSLDLHDVSRVTPRIYLSSIYPVTHHSEKLHHAGVTHIVTLLSPDHERVKSPRGVTHLRIEVKDVRVADLAIFFPQIMAFIDQALSTPTGLVLIHCEKGMSRSPATVVAYLLHSAKVSMTLKEAYEKVKSVRPLVHPNLGFMQQLVLFNGNTVEDQRFLCRYWLNWYDSRQQCKVDYESQEEVSNALQVLKNAQLDGEQAAHDLENRLRVSGSPIRIPSVK